MKPDKQRRFSTPRTHPLTLGELRRMLSSVSEVPDDYIVRSKDSQPIDVFEFVMETHGVEIFHIMAGSFHTGTINLPVG
jgi:hypothetical protein